MLFKLCDTDHDGHLTQAELTDFFIVLGKADLERRGDEQIEDNMDQIKQMVATIFGDKTVMSESEFRQAIIDNPILQNFCTGLSAAFSINLSSAGK